MTNPGEEITGNYLKWVLNCDFVEYNPAIKNPKGEIDVIGYNIDENTVYICEVATHLETGLQYTKDNQPDNFDRLSKKFERDMQYGSEYWPDYSVVYMLWSPIVKSTRPGSKHNQMDDLVRLNDQLQKKFGDYGKVELIINEKYLACLQELTKIALEKTEAMPTTIMRFLQIYEKTKRHVSKLNSD